jgi:hypothetical protein
MSSCIFSGSRKGNGKRTVGTLGKPGFKAGRCREAVGIKKRAWSSSRSSVGVLNVEDAGRVTQGQRVEEMTMTSLISLAVAFLNFLHAASRGGRILHAGKKGGFLGHGGRAKLKTYSKWLLYNNR